MDNKEMNLNELELAAGGKGGMVYRPREEDGYFIYKIKSGDTLTRIANRFHTTVEILKAINDSITNVNDITAGRYIYVPEYVDAEG